LHDMINKWKKELKIKHLYLYVCMYLLHFWYTNKFFLHLV
jgi:hypothetical protein